MGIRSMRLLRQHAARNATVVGVLLTAVLSTASLAIADDAQTSWNTFLGGSGQEYGYSIAVDDARHVWVAGRSEDWGSPMVDYTFGGDAFVAKLDPSGQLIWHSFLGGMGYDYIYGLDVDGQGNAYVAGWSSQAWGSPVRGFTSDRDAFAAKLDSSGELQWLTFLGGTESDEGFAIAVDDGGCSYVCGYCRSSWGSPVRAYQGPPNPSATAEHDAFVAKLDDSGVLVWNTFLGGPDTDYGHGLAVDSDGNAFVSGKTCTTWGEGEGTVDTNPVRPYESSRGGFVAKLDDSGVLQWNTFLGQDGKGIAVDSGGGVYAVGQAASTWGSPVRDFGSGTDAFVVALDVPTGTLEWNTFLGGEGADEARGIAIDTRGNLCVVGTSNVTWGSPVRPYNSNDDAFIATVDADSGSLCWNSFAGGGGEDEANACATREAGVIFVAGSSDDTWGNPIRSHYGSSNSDAFVARLSPDMRVVGNSVAIANGDDTPSLDDHTDFGSADVDGETAVYTFAVANQGVPDLLLHGNPAVAVSGVQATDFTVTAQPASAVPADSTTSFDVTFDPQSIGVRMATIEIPNNDPDNDPFVFAIQGRGTTVLSVTGIAAVDKVYDGTSNATLDTTGASLIGVWGDDDVTLNFSGGIGVFSDKDVGVDKTVTVSGLTLEGTDADNYTLTQPCTSASITPRRLTVTGIVASDKPYDGTANATLDTSRAMLVGVVGDDDVSLDKSCAVAAFIDEQAGSDKDVFLSGLTIQGTDAANYSLDQPTTVAAITACELEVSGITASDKLYDGTSWATLNLAGAILVGAVEGDEVTLNTSSAVGNFLSPDVGVDKAVYVSGLLLEGKDAENYSVVQPTTPASILFPVELHPGWNMVSVPVTPSDPSVLSVFPDIEAIYTWNAALKSYTVPTSIDSGRGYWVAESTERVVGIEGDPVEQWSRTVLSGWNAIGSACGHVVDFSNPDDNPDKSVEGFAYAWDPLTKSYVYTTDIEPGKGYWIAATADCTLAMSAPT